MLNAYLLLISALLEKFFGLNKGLVEPKTTANGRRENKEYGRFKAVSH